MGALRVLIAGGGIAAAEALLALDDLASDRVRVELIAPNEWLVYRPHLVAEPFTQAPVMRRRLDRLAGEHGARHRRDALASVDPGSRTIGIAGGRRLEYDALLIATGARPVAAVPGALSFGESSDRGAFRALLAELEPGAPRRLAFAVPAGVRWSLPAYELALLSAAHLRARGISTVEIAIATHERRPLELLGEGAPEIVGDLLAEAGIELRAGTAPVRYDRPVLELGDGRIEADEVVALPVLEVPEIEGIPQRDGGFIPTDVRLNVEGMTEVWAAGDATWFPIKQGGLAAQQADVAAQSIAVRAGASLPTSSFRPVLRAAMLTGVLPRYFRAALFAGSEPVASPTALWSPPVKLAGRYLAPYLSAAAHAGGGFGELVDLEPPPDAEPGAAGGGPSRDLEFALAAADADARQGDYAGALGWLAAIEEMALVLPPAYLERREAWRRGAPDAQAPTAPQPG
jgi:sulfide:quinone oxidoreductase